MKSSRFVFGSGLLSAAILMTGMFGVAGAQTEGIPIALVQHAIHDPQISSSADAEASPRLEPRKAIIRARISPYFILSAGVYTAAWLDMTETQSSMPNFKEEDALVRPFLLLPKPLYYASGTMLGTGVNWLGLKHANQRSRIADDRDQAESERGMRFDLAVKEARPEP